MEKRMKEQKTVGCGDTVIFNMGEIKGSENYTNGS